MKESEFLKEDEYPEEPEFREKPYFQGLDAYAERTFDCDNGACFYNQYGRCIYNIAPIQFYSSKACYDPFEERNPD